MHVRVVYHTIFWAWTMFHLRVFSIDIHKKCNSNHYLLLLVIFHDLRMTQFWPGKYVCLVYKLKLSLWTCPKFWAIFMTDLWPLYLELLYLEPQFLVIFGDCRNMFFDKKLFKILFSFYPKPGRTGSRKTFITQTWLVTESCPTPHWITFLIFCRLVFDIPSHLNGLILA